MRRKPNSLNSFFTAKDAELLQGFMAILNHLSSLIFTHVDSKNRKNSDQNRNSNHETNDSRKRVCGDRFSHGFGFVPAAGRISPVFNAFFFVTSCLRVKQILNVFKLEASSYKLFAFNSFAFRRSDRSAWTKADSPSQNRSAKSRFATVQPISPLAVLFPQPSTPQNL